ncbi:MAG TPA: hypothetical protein DD490_24310 [Acidobacteria bacterium]|nr:hypothetical protein [Acidobacteriota bacterium]
MSLPSLVSSSSREAGPPAAASPSGDKPSQDTPARGLARFVKSPGNDESIGTNTMSTTPTHQERRNPEIFSSRAFLVGTNRQTDLLSLRCRGGF